MIEFLKEKEHSMPASDNVYDRIPVRIVLNGKKTNNDNTEELFEYWYEFSQFRAQVIRRDVFEVRTLESQ